MEHFRRTRTRTTRSHHQTLHSPGGFAIPQGRTVPALVTTEAVGQKLLASNDTSSAATEGVRFWDAANTLSGRVQQSFTGTLPEIENGIGLGCRVSGPPSHRISIPVNTYC